jgi:predicted acylesterase/phospholipase RssA
MFGAYQVGAWKVLSRHFKPDLVVGVSIGSLNAWMVACGCDASMLEEHWLLGDALSRPKFRVPRTWRQGILDPGAAHATMQRMHRELKPVLPLGIVIRRLPSLRPEVICNEQISCWRYLAASCAIPFVFDLQQFNGATYADGGLLDPLPFFAARQMGATSMIGLNCMTWGGWGLDAPQIRPSKRLGLLPSEAMVWNRENVERWMKQGEQDANAFLIQYPQHSGEGQKTFAENLF